MATSTCRCGRASVIASALAMHLRLSRAHDNEGVAVWMLSRNWGQTVENRSERATPQIKGQAAARDGRRIWCKPDAAGAGETLTTRVTDHRTHVEKR
jgi:hypothetical protein